MKHITSEVATACGLDDPNALFLPFSNPQLNNDPPAIPALIEREMLARHTALGLEPEVRGCFVCVSLRERDGEFGSFCYV